METVQDPIVKIYVASSSERDLILKVKFKDTVMWLYLTLGNWQKNNLSKKNNLRHIFVTIRLRLRSAYTEPLRAI